MPVGVITTVSRSKTSRSPETGQFAVPPAASWRSSTMTSRRFTTGFFTFTGRYASTAPTACSLSPAGLSAQRAGLASEGKGVSSQTSRNRNAHHGGRRANRQRAAGSGLCSLMASAGSIRPSGARVAKTVISSPGTSTTAVCLSGATKPSPVRRFHPSDVRPGFI